MLTQLQEATTEQDIRAILKDVMHPDFVDKWMMSSIPYFDNEKPVNLIKEGKINRVKIMIHYFLPT